MEELNDNVNDEFLKAVKGEGDPITFSPEERAKCREKYIKFSKEESKIEAEVRMERVLAAATPDVYLSF